MMLFALTVSSAAFTGCSSDDDNEVQQPQTASLIGKWQQTNSYGTIITLTFNADSTGNCLYEYSNNNFDSEYFEYQYDSTEHELRVIGDTQLEGDYDVTITANKLRLEFYYYDEYDETYYEGIWEFNRVK